MKMLSSVRGNPESRISQRDCRSSDIIWPLAVVAETIGFIIIVVIPGTFPVSLWFDCYYAMRLLLSDVRADGCLEDGALIGLRLEARTVFHCADEMSHALDPMNFVTFPEPGVIHNGP